MAQVEYLRSDERLIEHARAMLGMTPEERLQHAYALCRKAAELLARVPPEERDRVGALDRPRAEAAPVLKRLAGFPPGLPT